MKQIFNSEQFHKDVQISRAHLEDEFCDNPSLLAYYGEQVALWTQVYDTYKLLVKNKHSELTVQMKDDGVKGTVDYVRAKVESHSDYITLNKKLIEAKAQSALYENAVNALEKKQFSLGSLNAMNRTEMDASNAYSNARYNQEERLAAREKLVKSQG